ncbi:MAG TPA: alpha/beta family hydrolase [Nitrososphaeraceae archaeon]|nr:alpha/beta family hydrolase [Nitrososphaeraceae archaeon]
MSSSLNEVLIGYDSVSLRGNLLIPRDANGIVIFAHGSGSSRHSPRNNYIAQALNDKGVATLLFDLLTKEEEEKDRWTGHIRFNIPLLADRLISTTCWIKNSRQTGRLKIGYFGASTGAAAALVAAAKMPNLIDVVVSRGGRPDLAGKALAQVKAPTLLIVGENDKTVIDLNRKALKSLKHVNNKKIIIIPGASHLFEEPGALEKVSRVATDWFLIYLGNTMPVSSF